MIKRKYNVEEKAKGHKTLHRKLKIEQHEFKIPLKTGGKFTSLAQIS